MNKKCVKCGHLLPEDASFCPYCTAVQAEKQEIKAPRRWKKKTFVTVAVLVVLAGVGFVFSLYHKPKVYEADTQIVYPDKDHSYKLLVTYSESDGMAGQAQGDRTDTLADGLDSALSCQLYVLNEETGEVAWEEFAGKVKSCEVETVPQENSKKLEYTEPVYDENFPNAAYVSNLHFMADTGSNDIFWKLTMENGDTVSLKTRLTIEKQEVVTYRPEDTPMETTEELNALLASIKKEVSSDTPVYLYLPAVTYEEETDMKKQKRSWKRVLAVLFVLCMLSTLAPELVSSAASTQKVQISAKKMTLIKGQKKTLKLKGNKKKVKWSSTKKSVAAVSAKGIVTAKKAGATVIRAKVGTKTYSCKVTVEAPKLSKTSITLKEGSSYQLKVTGTKQKVKWRSSSSAVSVSSTGKVKAKQVTKDTSARITATVGGKKYTCKVLVKDVKASKPEPSQPETEKPSQPETEQPKPSQPETEQPQPETPKPQVTGFAKLKSYILTQGSENKSGNYFINMKNLYKGTNYTYGIVYNQAEDQLEFLFLTESSKNKSSMTMCVMENPASAPTNYLFILNNMSGGFEVNASLNPATYDGETTIAFQVKSSVGGAPYQSINELANSALQTGFAGWSMLLERSGLTFKDLGFIAYNG